MIATSAAQSRAWAEGGVPPLEEVTDGVWAVGVPMPEPHLPASLAYLLRDEAGGVHVVDPGWSSDENWLLLRAALDGIGAAVADVASITITHLHPDHAGLARRLQEQSGAPVRLHARELESWAALDAAAAGETAASITAGFDRWGVPAERRTELRDLAGAASRLAGWEGVETTALADGEALDAPGLRVTAMLTPGHTPGSLCLRDERNGLLLTGDHLLPILVSGLGLGGDLATNPLADFLDSADRVAALDDHEALPGHGYRFSGIAGRAAEAAEHHLRRTREVAAELARDPGQSTWQLASRLTWTAGWENLAGGYLRSALRQTDLHRDFATSHPDDPRLRPR